MEFKVNMVTSADVNITTESGQLKWILGTEEVKTTEFGNPLLCVKCGERLFDIDDNENRDVSCCSCGNTRFFAKQICYHDIIVDSDNLFLRNIEIAEAGNPYGAYRCTKCGKEYEYLSDLEKSSQN